MTSLDIIIPYLFALFHFLKSNLSYKVSYKVIFNSIQFKFVYILETFIVKHYSYMERFVESQITENN